MNLKREIIQEARDFNSGWKNLTAKKFYGKEYNELNSEEQLDIDDIIESNEE